MSLASRCGPLRRREFAWRDHATRSLRLLRSTSQSPSNRHGPRVPAEGRIPASLLGFHRYAAFQDLEG